MLQFASPLTTCTVECDAYKEGFTENQYRLGLSKEPTPSTVGICSKSTSSKTRDGCTRRNDGLCLLDVLDTAGQEGCTNPFLPPKQQAPPKLIQHFLSTSLKTIEYSSMRDQWIRDSGTAYCLYDTACLFLDVCFDVVCQHFLRCYDACLQRDELSFI
jgi:hypothetical protein